MAKKKGINNLSILSWISSNGIKSEKGELLSYHDRLFWLDVLSDWNPNIVIKGAAQIGKSVNFTLKVLYAIKHYGMSCIYTFPTDSDTKEFVQSKINPMIVNNRHVFDGLNSDSVERKEIDGNFVHFKGTVSKTAGISTTADVVIHDEASRSDRVTMETMRSRTKGSKFKGRWLFSNPSTDGDEIEEEWKLSDRKEWHVTCPECKLEQMMTWPDNVDIPGKRYVCLDCDATLPDETRRTGRWIATNPESKISGYHLSHLICCWITAEEVIRDSEKSEEYFHNFVLGEPYTPSVLAITRTLLIDAWTPKTLETGKWYLGVDVGNFKHYVLGSENGVVKVGRFANWTELDDLVKMYDPFSVIDAMPENEISRAYVSQNRKFSMCYLGGTDKESNRIVRFGEKEEQGIIKADRNRLIDWTVSRLQQGEIPFHLPADAMYRMFLKHCLDLRKIKEVNRQGIERYVWESRTGEDHLFFALMFYELARMGFDGNAVLIEDFEKPPEPIVMGQEGFELNLDEYFKYRERNE